MTTTPLAAFKRTMRRIQKRMICAGARSLTVRQICQAETPLRTPDFARWAQEDRRDAKRANRPRCERDRLRRQAFFYERAAHAVARYLAAIAPNTTP